MSPETQIPARLRASLSQSPIEINDKSPPLVRRKMPLRSFYIAQVLDSEWRTHQELNLKPSDP
jgi:hypothetical protein